MPRPPRRIVKLEADYAQSQSPGGPRPGKTNGVAEPRPIDILELLSKAKEEYHRVRDAHQTLGRLIGTLHRHAHTQEKYPR